MLTPALTITPVAFAIPGSKRQTKPRSARVPSAAVITARLPRLIGRPRRRCPAASGR